MWRAQALVAEGRRWHLYRIVEGGDTVQLIEVVLGFENGDRIEIVESVEADRPLDAGDRIVVVGAPALSDGSKIQVVTEESETEETAAPEQGE